MAFSLGEYQDIFLEESDEQLEELNKNLVELEKNPNDPEIINNIFRAAHSFKSSAAFVGLNDLSELAHEMENLLQGLRDKTMEMTPEIVDIIFKCFDVIRSVIETVAEGNPPTQDLEPIKQRVIEVGKKQAGGVNQTPAEQAEAPKSQNVKVPKMVLTNDDMKLLKAEMDSEHRCFEITVFIEQDAQMKWLKAQLVVGNFEREGEVFKTFPSESQSELDVFKFICTIPDPGKIDSLCDVDQIEKVIVKEVKMIQQGDKVSFKLEAFKAGEYKEADIEKAAIPIISQVSEERVDVTSMSSSVSNVQGDADHDHKKSSLIKTVKVSIDKLDQLLNNVGELVIANSGFYRLYEEIRKYSDGNRLINEFKNRIEQMSRIAKDLQTGIMKTRMVPIGQVFSRFNRLVRDLAKESNKKVELIVKGEDTELDKKVIDAIGEPLMHLIRNSIDHGVETEEERAKSGKPDTAKITLNAYQGGNQIIVEVIDDGRGLDYDRIKEKIIERGLASVESVSSMTRSEVYDHIFAPGFSTADKITDISGRGVGMNVVREIVSELNGTVTINTEKGEGTTFNLAFPLTLAIIPAIMTRLSGDMYAVPLPDVSETIKINEEEITTIEGHEVINLRGEILSLLRLSDFVKLKSKPKQDEKIPVVVVQYGNRRIGLIVDDLQGKMEIVIKSLEQNYKTVEGLAGASILGDGSICLILDVANMVNRTLADFEKYSHQELQAMLEKTEAERLEDASSKADITRDDEESFRFEDKQFEEEESEKEEEAVEDEYDEEEEDDYEDDDEDDEDIEEDDDVNIEDENLKKEESEESIEEESIEDENFEKEEDDEDIEDEDEASELVYDDELENFLENILNEDDVLNVDLDSDVIEEDKNLDAGESVEAKVQATLDDFRSEFQENVKTILSVSDKSESIYSKLNISESAVRKFGSIANIGAANAAEALSKILNKRIDLSIPDVTVVKTEDIPQRIGDVSEKYFGVYLPIMEGDIKGSLIFVLEENSTFGWLESLIGESSKDDDNVLTEDGFSALKEVTNIVGAAILNVISEKIDLAVMPDVPFVVHDLMDKIFASQKLQNEYAIMMDTAFFFEDDQAIGNMILLPETDSMVIIADRMNRE